LAYRLVIFDFDGTLADSFPWFIRVVNDAAAKFRFRPIEPHDIDRLRGMGARDVAAYLGVPGWKLPLIATYMRQRKARDLSEIRLFEGAAEMLHGLRDAGMTTALVSSNAEANIRGILGPLAALIDHYACGASLFGKAAKFRKVLKTCAVEGREAIAIGDEIRDAEAARSAGIAFGAVNWGYTLPEALAACGPDLQFARVGEIAERIGQAA
jgi:phosphoglycolate phosphatase